MHHFLLVGRGLGLVKEYRLVFNFVAVLKLAQVVIVNVPGARDADFICKFEEIRNLIFFIVRGKIHASLHVLHTARVRNRGAMLLCLQVELRLGHGFYLRRVFLQCHRRSNFSTGTSLA